MIATRHSSDINLDSWRKAPSARSNRHETPAVITSQVDTGSKWATSLTAIDNSAFIAISSATTSNNFHIIENASKNKLVEEENVGMLNLISSYSMQYPSYHLSSSINHILSSGPNGLVQLYRISPQDFKLVGKGVEKIQDCLLSTLGINDIPISPPKKMIRSVRITCTSFEPTNFGAATSAQKFAGAQGANLYLYDLSAAKVICTEKFANPISKITYSPHAPFGSLLATCSHDSSISIIDTRLLQSGDQAKAWLHSDAHVGQVTDISFNNFVPFWLASSGEDGVVKLWDLRYLKNEAARIDAHYDSIHSIAWSNTHCDVLSSASSDLSWKAWSFNSDCMTAKVPWKESMIGCPGSEFETEFDRNDNNLIIGAKLYGDYSKYDSPLVSLATATSHADTSYTLTAFGVVTSHTIRSKVFEGQLDHQYENTFEQAVETAIHNRNLSEAYETMIKISRTELSRDDSSLVREGNLIEHCKSRPAIKESSWVMGSRNECNIAMVQREMKEYSYGLPPKFGEFPQWNSLVSAFIQIQFDLVLLRYNLVSEIKKGNWQIILEQEKNIMAGMEYDDEFLDTQTIEMIVEAVILQNPIKGMNIGLGLGQLLADLPKFKFDTLSEMMHLLIFPTVYDYFEWIPDREIDLARQNSAARQEYIIRYLQFLKDEKHALLLQEIATSKSNVRSSKVSPTDSAMSYQYQRRISKADGEVNAKSLKKIILSVLGDGKSALPMISLEIRLLKLVDSPPDDFQEEVIKIMQNVLTDSGVSGTKSRGAVIPFERTISVISNKLYLNALSETKRYEEYFGVAVSMIVSYYPIEFFKSVLRQANQVGLPGIKSYITSMVTAANNQLNSALTATTNAGGAVPQTIITCVKLLKDCVVMAVKITAHLMDGMESLKSDKDCTDTLSNIMTTMTGLMMLIFLSRLISAALLRSFEHFDRIAKSVCKFLILIRQYAHTVHDSLRDAARLLPLSGNKTRPVNTAEKASNGLTIQEEAFSILEKLYKGYLKAENNAQ